MHNHAKTRPVDVTCTDCGETATLTFVSKMFGAMFGFPDDAESGEDIWFQFDDGWRCSEDAADHLGMDPDFPDPDELRDEDE